MYISPGIPIMSVLKITHPNLYAKLINEDTSPDPITKHKSKTKPKRIQTTLVEHKNTLPEPILEEPVFTDTGYFNDSCNIPVDAIVEHIINEGNEEITGLVEQEDGTLERIAEIEDPEVDPATIEAVTVEKAQETSEELDLGRGKQTRISTKLYSKDWVYTEDCSVEVEKKTKQWKSGKKAGI
ncbi:hypothetical protein F5050DRAFT_1715021 [Lentinula boryana]|uniref:Uncharacterized protein n=1 Tax=Lentinula boryana TaxID=40481 RepID=A0ABQ8Q245_9AGAR|nr:hypothetical protein F5050DRAFT_1715021 [Lentinula boryana]